MANPLAWLPYHGDRAARRGLLLGAALVLSSVAHVVLPFVRFSSVEAVSVEPMVVTLVPPPPMPLPEAEELVPEPNEVDSDAPEVEDEEARLPAAPTPEAVKKVTEPVAEPEPKPMPEPEPVEEPPPVEAPPPPLPAVDNAEAAKRLAELEQRRAERAAERARRRAERAARRKAALDKGAGGRKGGAPPSGEWKTGTPDAVYLCGAEDRGAELYVTRTRPLSEWIPIVPTVFAGFPTRPSIGGYLDDVQLIQARDRSKIRRIGFVELALPNDVMQIELEEPRGVRLAFGRLDARCLIGFKYGSQLFPVVLMRAPVRVIDRQNNAVSALVNVSVFKDASVEVSAADGTPLPFTRGRIKNARAIQANIQDHYEAARLARSIADLFGIDVTPHASPGAAKKREVPPVTRRALAQGQGKKGEP
ncbi:MAG: hypothetical protein IT383_21515 [Deltaproteobacteria bacterium]|nr:hypothetical protein [Deltaproteobacteria bacterium]